MTKTLRVLILDDSETGVDALIQEICRGGYDVVHRRANSLEALSAILEAETWDLLLAQGSFAGAGAGLALERLQQLGVDLPFIVVCGLEGEEMAWAALRSGAHDYVRRENLARLVPALQRRLRDCRRPRSHAIRAEEGPPDLGQLTPGRWRANERELRQLAEQIRGVFWMSDVAKNEMIYVSPGYEEIWGRSCRSLYEEPRDWMEAVHAEDRERVCRAALTKQASGEYEEEYRIQRPDGTIRWIRERAFPIRDEGGRVYGIAGIAEDVTAHKLAEEALRRSESDLADFFENAPVGLHWLGPDGRILRVNQAELELLGFARDEYVGRHISEFHVDKKVIDDLLRRLTARETVRNCEARLRCQDGSIRHVLIDANVLWEQGRFVHSRGFTRDISEVKQAQEVLRESEGRFRSLFEHAPIAIALHGADGKYLQTNRAYQRMLGYPDEELRRLGVKGVTYPYDIEEGRILFHELVEGKRDFYQREKRYLRSDGTLVWAQSTASAVRSPSGKLRYIISMVEDITDRRKLAQEILSISEREQQRFGRDLHDGLCQSLIGLKFKGTLLERKLQEKSAAEARDAHAIVALLNQTIEEAHHLAQGLHPVNVESDGLMGALQELAANTESLFGVECRCHFRHRVLIRDNPAAVHLYRIAQEAISNAIKHGKADQLWVGLAARAEHVTLWVRDNGAGFSTKQQKSSGGMGLHIMRHRARMIGAALDFSRRKHGGTRVTCRWPLFNPKTSPATES